MLPGKEESTRQFDTRLSHETYWQYSHVTIESINLHSIYQTRHLMIEDMKLGIVSYYPGSFS